MSAKLFPRQIEHYKRLEKALCCGFGYFDQSETGLGKTYIACEIAKQHSMKLFVVGPKTILPYWKQVADEFGVTLISSMSYELLRGSSGRINHPFLTYERNDYTVTNDYNNYVKQGILLVFDEVHRLKNTKTNQRKAALALVRAIVKLNVGSRIAILSATPFDKDEHCESVIMLLGLTSKSKLYLYSPRTRVYLNAGIKDVEAVCQRLNPVKTSDCAYMKANPQLYPYELYTNILKHYFCSAMPPPKIAVIKDTKNGFYAMSEISVSLLYNAQRKLRSSLRKNELGEYIRDEHFTEATSIYISEMEKAKLPTLIRLTQETLNNSNNKVIIYVWRRASIDKLSDALKEYNPLILNGSTKGKNRPEIIDNFQQHNNNYRLLISHPKVGGEGISLDDRDGNYPRFIYAIPNYYFILMHQLTGRIHRGEKTKSKATIRFVYSRDCLTETSVLNSLIRKDRTMRKSLRDNSSDTKYPGSYERYLEPSEININNKDNKDKIPT